MSVWEDRKAINRNGILVMCEIARNNLTEIISDNLNDSDDLKGTGNLKLIIQQIKVVEDTLKEYLLLVELLSEENK